MPEQKNNLQSASPERCTQKAQFDSNDATKAWHEGDQENSEEYLEGLTQYQLVKDEQQKRLALAKKKRVIRFTINSISLIFVILIVLAFTIPVPGGYTPRTRVGEGLILASSAKNQVVDNAVNGFELNKYWDENSFISTENTESIQIDARTGAITITSKGVVEGVKLIIVPFTGSPNHAESLQAGTVPEGRIAWRCYYLETPKTSYIPNECRERYEEK